MMIAVCAVRSGQIVPIGHKVIKRQVIRGVQAVSAVLSLIVMVVATLELKPSKERKM